MDEAPLIQTLDMFLERMGRVEAIVEKAGRDAAQAVRNTAALMRAEKLRCQREESFSASGGGVDAVFDYPIVGDLNLRRVTVHSDEGFGHFEDGERVHIPRTAAAEISFGLPAIRCGANGTPNYSEWATRAKTLQNRHGLEAHAPVVGIRDHSFGDHREMDEAPLIQTLDMFLERMGRVEEIVEKAARDAAQALRNTAALMRAEKLRCQREESFSASGGGVDAVFDYPIVGDLNLRRVRVFSDGGVADADAVRIPRTSAAEISFGLPAIRCGANGTPNYSEWAARAKVLLERHGLEYIKVATSGRGSGSLAIYLKNDSPMAMKAWDEWAAIAYAVVADDLLDVEFPGVSTDTPGMAEYSWTPGRLSREAFVLMQVYDDAIEADGVVDLA